MPGWIGHNINVNLKENIVKIDLVEPASAIASEVNSDLARFSAKVHGGMGGLVEEVARISQSSQISALTSLGSNKTGKLAGSISIESTGTSAQIGTDLFYASYVNDGRGSIVAVGKALHFFVDGNEIFTKSVGPASPRPYVDISGSMLEGQIDGIIDKYMGSLL